MKNTIKVAIFAVFIGLIFLIFCNCNRNTKIENTPMFVKEIRKISQLATLRQVRDVIISDTLINEVHEKSMLFWKWGDITTEKYLLVQIGTVNIKAGFNLEKIKGSDVKINGNKLRIKLPPAEILEVSLNPSGIQPYYEEKIEGDWEDESMIQKKKNEMYGKFEEIAKQKSINDGILDRATELGKERLHGFFTALGFSEVVIEIG